jgi:hypothetical protein
MQGSIVTALNFLGIKSGAEQLSIFVAALIAALMVVGYAQGPGDKTPTPPTTTTPEVKPPTAAPATPPTEIVATSPTPAPITEQKTT